MKIYTKTGDKGKTSLLSGNRVDKDHLRIEAYGTIDELNSHIGLLNAKKRLAFCHGTLKDIQNRLFSIASNLALDMPSESIKLTKIDKEDVLKLEREIDKMNAEMPRLINFILPGGSEESAYIHISRTICRRSERLVVGIARDEAVDDDIIVYLNRLSDYLFVLARYANHLLGVKDESWESNYKDKEK